MRGRETVDNIHQRKGKFIVFEGLDGSGKTTQIRSLALRLAAENKRAEITCEPTKGDIGKMIRKCLSYEIPADSHVIAALFAADRLDHMLRPDGLLNTLAEDVYVLCDRYYLSSYAYQSIDTDLKWIMDINAVSAQKLKPDCHIFIDITPELALERLSQRKTLEMFEEYEKLKLIYENFHSVIEKLKDTENIVVIDGSQTELTVINDIWNVIRTL